MINSNRITSMVTIHRPAHIDSMATADSSRDRSGFTLVELLVSMCVSLMLLGGVVSLFGTLGESVNDSKSNGEMLHTMRHAARQLQSDLGNVSLVPDPAETQTNPQGFFEYVEGPFNDRAAVSTDPIDQPCPDPEIIDVGAAEATGNGWKINNGPKRYSYNNNNLRNYNNAKNRSVTWTKSGLGKGTYRVSMTWPTGWKNGWENMHWSRWPVTISSSEDSQTVDVDQTQIPNDLSDPTASSEKGGPIMWHHLGEIAVGDDGQLVVQLGPYEWQKGEDTGKHLYADAIRIECLGLDPITPNGGNDGTLPLVGDCDDVLHFTTKTDEGAHEVVWFLTPMSPHKPGSIPTGSTRYRLHRIQLNVNPQESDLVNAVNLSKGVVLDSQTLRPTTSPVTRQANSLRDLAIRANRWAHINGASADRSQFNIIPVEEYKKDNDNTPPNTPPNLFTYMKALADDCGLDDEHMDHVNWPANEEIYKTWLRETSKTVILENVIGFDVQAYDPDVAIYSATVSGGQTVPLLPSDPGWSAAHQNADNVPAIGTGAFRDLDPAQADDLNSPLKTLSTANGPVATYDSWSGDYVKDGEVGFDNWNAAGQQVTDGIVDTAEDLREKPPYDAPLKAVQVEIRVQEPKSGKVRSVKVRKFLGKR